MSNDNEELPDDEEEILVYVEFDGSVASNALANEKLQLDMVGLDMEHPIMQINGKFYEGTYHDAVGTYMFFETDNNPHVDDPVFDATPTLKYMAKTRKVLKMSRIFVEPKTEMLGDSNDPEFVPNMKVIQQAGIAPRYQAGTFESWKKMRDNRMEALNDYLEKQRIRDEKRSQGIEPDSDSDDDNPFAIYKPEKHQEGQKLENRWNSLSEENQNSADDRETDDKSSRVNEKRIELDSNISPVIDPGPSTSKDSKPWKSPPMINPNESFSTLDSSDDTYHMNLTNVRGMHRATVQETKKAKIRKCGKISRKQSTKTNCKAVESSVKANLTPEKPNETDSSKIGEETRTKDESAENNDNEIDIEDPTGTLKSIEQLLISQSTEEMPKHTDMDNPEKTEEPVSTIDKRKLEKQQRRDKKMRHIAEKLKKTADELRLKNKQESGEI